MQNEQTQRAKLLNGDCRETLKTLEASSIDSIVTDPPYELGFMGKIWDASGIAYDVALWREALRVLKPGGHLLAFGGSRTYHRLACAIEDAGFEIRDQIMWLYGSGFPKSLDVSKAIDKYRRRDYVLAAVKLGMEIPGNNLHDWTKAEHSPSDAWWADFKTYLTADQWQALEREVTGRNERPAGWFTSQDGHDITAPATEAAKQWNGWGTALKPAHEPIVVARKPLIGTVAETVLRHGTGALNIDGCRVDLNGDYKCKANRRPSQTGLGDNYDPTKANQPSDIGRWPANVIHDGSVEVLAAFPQAPGQSGSVTGNEPSSKTNNVYGQFKGRPATQPQGDSGSAARFFYCAKASRKDRGDGNLHPTVKPTELMRYLCRLVTPPGGLVLDPFTGSGSTGKAALLEGFRFIGIEQSAEYFEIAKARISPGHEQPEMIIPMPERKPEPERELDLFSFGGHDQLQSSDRPVKGAATAEPPHLSRPTDSPNEIAAGARLCLA